MAEPVYATVIGAARGLIGAMGWKVFVYGEEHVPASGPAVIATNHIGYLDFVFAGYAARERGRRVRFLAKKEVFDKGGAGWLMRRMKHIPVDRFGAPNDSLDTAVEALGRGEVVGMFPEATISPSFIPRPGKNGAVRMAQRSGAPLVPAAIWGTQRLLTKWRPKSFQRGVAIVVNVGAPLALDTEEDPNAATERLMTRIGELLVEAQDRYPQKPADENDRWWMPAHLGGSAPTYEDAERRLVEERETKGRTRRAG